MRKILIIDDDEQMRNLLCRAMEYAGFEADVASDGRKGLRLFEEAHYDLVITDLIMPEQEGMETITFLRRNHPDIKIIAISGEGVSGRKPICPLPRNWAQMRPLPNPFPLMI